jgi:selenocysteine lyase/cysteine desulfurase
VRRAFAQQLQPPWVDVNSAPWSEGLQQGARRFETSEQAVALWLGLQPALALALELGVDRIAHRVQSLAAQLRERLTSIPGVTIRDESEGPRSGLVSFTVDGFSAPTVKARLAGKGIRVGANGEPYTPWDMKTRGLEGIVRASVSYLNAEADIDPLAEALATLQ